MLIEPPVSLYPDPGRGMGGVFSTVINAAGAFFIGDPALGNQIASQASMAYAPVNQNAAQIAKQIAPNVLTALKSPPQIDLSKLPARDQTVATSSAQAAAIELANEGYAFPLGTVGAEYQKPSIFDAFGGNYVGYVKIGAIVLGGALLLKVL